MLWFFSCTYVRHNPRCDAKYFLPFLVESIHMDYSTLMLRWVHILAASIAVGSLFYSRFAILPAIEEALDEASQVRMHEAIRKKWLRWVGGMIFFLLVSGLANFLVLNARAKGWGGGDWMKQTHYHLLFGIKFLLALSVFYFSSALTRSRRLGGGS